MESKRQEQKAWRWVMSLQSEAINMHPLYWQKEHLDALKHAIVNIYIGFSWKWIMIWMLASLWRQSSIQIRLSAWAVLLTRHTVERIKRVGEMIFLERIKWSCTCSWLAQLSFITCHITLVSVLAAPWDMPPPRGTDWNHFSSRLRIGHVIKELYCFCANTGWLTCSVLNMLRHRSDQFSAHGDMIWNSYVEGVEGSKPV